MAHDRRFGSRGFSNEAPPRLRAQQHGGSGITMPALLLRREGAYAEGESGRPTAPDMIYVYRAISIHYLMTAPLHANTRRLLHQKEQSGRNNDEIENLGLGRIGSWVCGRGREPAGLCPKPS